MKIKAPPHCVLLEHWYYWRTEPAVPRPRRSTVSATLSRVDTSQAVTGRATTVRPWAQPVWL